MEYVIKLGRQGIDTLRQYGKAGILLSRIVCQAPILTDPRTFNCPMSSNDAVIS